MIRKYGVFGIISLIYSKIRSLLVSKNIRIIRFPADLRNSGLIQFGKGFTAGVGCRLEVEVLFNDHVSGKKMIIGNNVQINDYVHITASRKVIIGDDVLIASKVYISDCTHGSYKGDEFDSSPDLVPIKRELKSEFIQIGDRVWLGESVSVLPGVVIGAGTIVGANSVVTKELPPNVIAVGNPARPIKKFNFDNNRWEKI